MKRLIVAAIAATLAGHAHAVYRCTAEGKTVYQDTPCPRGADEVRTGPESPRETAARKQTEAAAKAKADAAEKAEKAARDKAVEVWESKERERRAREIDSSSNSTLAWYHATYDVKVGMTSAEVQRMNPNFAGGKRRSMDGPNGRHDEWWEFESPQLTLHFINGVLAFIHR